MTTSEQPYNLDQAINAVLDETDLTDLTEIATKVLGGIPAKAKPQVLLILLRNYVRVKMAHGRMHAGRLTRPDASVAPLFTSKSSHSAKVATIRAHAAEWLHQRVYCGPDVGRKLVSDLVDADLAYWEESYDRIIQRSEAAQRRPRELRELLRVHGVVRVGDLPPSVLAAFEWQVAP